MDLLSLELTRRRADLVPHGRASLAHHLYGVRDVLLAWRQPDRVLRAGLFHSVYATEVFHVALFDPRERPHLRALLGPDAERLVHAFGGCPRDLLLTAAETDGGALDVLTRWGSSVALSRRDLSDLMTLHAANLAEQSAGLHGGPAPWLAMASRMLAAARIDREVAPPVLEGGARIVHAKEERALERAHRAALAGKPVDTAVVASSALGEPLVSAGLVALAARRGGEAARLGERALELLDAWGTPWDKRLSLDAWRAIARVLIADGRLRDRELEMASRRAGAVLERARRSPARLHAELEVLRAFDRAPKDRDASAKAEPGLPAREALPPRFVEYVAGLRTNEERPLLPFYPGLRAEPWHDTRAFPIVAELERLAPRIREEFQRLDPALFQDEAEPIERTGRWSVLFLLEMGRRRDAVLARCPTLRSLLDAHKVLTSQAGSMYFSRLDAHTRVAPHHGPTNLRIRCHLGLEVPERCGVRVGGLTSSWTEGRCIAFDDSFEHEVWNDSDARRIVLVLDLWHPDLSADEVALLVGLQRYGTASAATVAGFLARNEAARRGEPRAGSAVERAARAVADAPSDAKLHVALARELFRVERWVDAEKSLRTALDLDGTDPIVHNDLGWALGKQRDREGAIASYERALAIDPACGRARRNLATLLTEMERFPEALVLRRAELAADPSNAPALIATVSAALRAGDLALAAELAREQAATCRGTRWYPTPRSDDPPLPADVTWARQLTPSKLRHDIDQLKYLAGRGILARETAPVIDAYEDALDALAPLGPDARVPLTGETSARIGHVYNRVVYVRPTPRVARVLSDRWDPTAVEAAYLARRPSVVVVDDFLTEEALASLRAFCLESTVWSENRYKHGRLGSMFQDGFNCPLLIQLAEELRAAFPRVLVPEIPVRQIWGYKYASTAPAETPHADFARVNVNIWITPEQANLDPSTGGLDVYDVVAPADWDFATYNSNAGVRILELLASRKAKPRHIPYKMNRAMLFDSELFHATPAIRFRSGYEDRRMNVTVLYGARDGR